MEIHPLPFLEIRPQVTPQIHPPPLQRLFSVCEIGASFRPRSLIIGRVLPRLRRIGDAERAGKDGGGEGLAAHAAGDGDAGDGREVLGVAVEADVEGDFGRERRRLLW